MVSSKVKRSLSSRLRPWLALMLAAVALPSFAAPVGIGFRGLLEDGGKFVGYVIFGDKDVEQVSAQNPNGVPDLGRFLGGFWDVQVKGGSTTASAELSNLTGGRAPIETNQNANLIAILTLGPEAGELPRLELLFKPRAGYDADVQPTVHDIADFYPSLTNGNKTAFSRYQDKFGVSTNVVANSIEIFDATNLLPKPVPLPATAALFSLGCGVLLPWARRRGAVAA